MQLPTLTQSPAALPSTFPAVEVTGLYVHVPFCFHKCHYCDFYSITHQSPERMIAFVDRVLAEARKWAGRESPTLRPKTVFFGGGTPSLLPREQMARLIAGLRSIFDFSQCDEWTVECNPATVDADYCAMLRSSGVDRLSFGAQSFHREDLRLLERHHDPEDVPRSLDLARAAGFERLNVDLIFAIPGQSEESWAATLETAIGLGTSHLSCYGLTYEPNTPLAVKRRLGRITAAEEDIELRMLRHTRERLASAGMPAYEISNYAASGQECRHNLLYWNGGDYIGLGPSAASHVQGWRWKNRPHLGEWEEAVDAERLPADEVEHLSPPRRAGELAMLQLRLTRGIDFADFAARTGVDARIAFADPIERFSRAGLLERTAAGVRLSNAGLAVADSLAAEFLSEDQQSV
jgi:oxygen-independent coproporphyrinogen-3 oxidase